MYPYQSYEPGRAYLKNYLEDYQNDTCVGKYLKEIHKRRIPKNLGGDKDEPEFNRTKTYGGQFHFDYPGLINRVFSCQ